MTIFWIKIIACITMILDHIEYAFPNINNMYIGRISFPLFCFCAVEGYVHTRDLKKYLKRIFIAGILSQIPFIFFVKFPKLNSGGLNVMFTLFIGVLALKFFDVSQNKLIKILVVLSLGVIADFLQTDYGMWGVLLIFILYLFRENKIKKFIAYFIVVAYKYISWWSEYGYSNRMLLFWIFTLVPIIFILLYNGEQGKKIQKFYYWFYPVHIMLLVLISPYRNYVFQEVLLDLQKFIK